MLLALVICPRLEWKAPIRVGNAMPVGIAGLPALARRALADRDFALLTLGFFACGFQLAFLTVHLPAHLALCGLPTGLGVTALMLIGLFNIPGSWLCGRLGNVIRPEVALGGIYLLRTILVAIFAATVPTEWGTMIFAAAMGFIWLGTVRSTSTAIARRFGVADLGALYGVCFLSHQVGGFLGAGAGAIVVDMTGSYAAFWPVMLAVGAAGDRQQLGDAGAAAWRRHDDPAARRHFPCGAGIAGDAWRRRPSSPISPGRCSFPSRRRRARWLPGRLPAPGEPP